jgi:hypothetical protein
MRMRTNPRTIILAVVILAAVWVGIRLIINQPIIPEVITNLFKNITASKAG